MTDVKFDTIPIPSEKESFNKSPVPNPEFYTPSGIYYHQSGVDNLRGIYQEGFRLDRARGGGQFPLRGVFLKTMPNLLIGPGIGERQIEVTVKSGIKLLDIREESGPSFMKIPDNVAPEIGAQMRGKGDAGFGLAGWLERNGHYELAKNYYDILIAVLNLNPHLAKSEVEPIYHDLWPKIEKALELRGIHGLVFLDHYHYTDENRREQHFTALAIFNPDNVTPETFQHTEIPPSKLSVISKSSIDNIKHFPTKLLRDDLST